MPPITPPTMNFTDPLPAFPIDTYNEPREGKKCIPLEITWANVLATGKSAIQFNFQNNTTLEVSKISGLVVDNSQCGSDLDFIFPDNPVTITIPAYAPYTVLDVHSNQQQFAVKARGAISGDITFIQLLNFAPPPVAVPITVQQKTAAIANASIINGGPTPIVAAGVNGTLQGLNVSFATVTPPANFNANIVIKDGNNNIIWAGNAVGITTGANGAELISINGLNVRFQNGLTVTITGAAAASGTYSINAYYITP